MYTAQDIKRLFSDLALIFCIFALRKIVDFYASIEFVNDLFDVYANSEICEIENDAKLDVGARAKVYDSKTKSFFWGTVFAVGQDRKTLTDQIDEHIESLNEDRLKQLEDFDESGDDSPLAKKKRPAFVKEKRPSKKKRVFPTLCLRMQIVFLHSFENKKTTTEITHSQITLFFLANFKKHKRKLLISPEKFCVKNSKKLHYVTY